MHARQAHRAADAAARESYGKLVAFLTARGAQLVAAEDALADAFAAALDGWPKDGVPRNPEAWLLVAARHRLVDRARRERRFVALDDALATAATLAEDELDRTEALSDERLAMLFACAHPSLPRAIHGPLMLQAVLGFNAQRIASAFLVAPATMGQRLVRAKRKIAAAGIPLRVPFNDELPERLDAVLGAIYAAFSAGWEDPAGLDPRSEGFTLEAIDLGRLVVRLVPHEPEPLGLLALMLHAAARRDARRNPAGEFVPLDAQDVTRWNAALVDEAEASLRFAASHGRRGRFQIEAAIQSAHAVRRYGREPDWHAIVLLYRELLALTQSPVVAVNWAVALGRAGEPSRGYAEVIVLEPLLRDYQPYWAAKATLAAACGETQLAREAFERAIGLAIDPSVRTHLASRRDALNLDRTS